MRAFICPPTSQLSDRAAAEINDFAHHLEHHRNGSYAGCAFCLTRINNAQNGFARWGYVTAGPSDYRAVMIASNGRHIVHAARFRRESDARAYVTDRQKGYRVSAITQTVTP